MKKKLICFSLIFIIVISLGVATCLSFTTDVDFTVNSDVVYMINMDSEVSIFEKNIDKKVPPASLVKIMTAIITLESINDIDKTFVTAPSYIYDEFYGIDVSNADVRRDEKLSVKDLLYSMVLQSACESASILADYIGKGNISNFVELMNKKAVELGAKDTNFTNAHGLPNKTQYTTAKDMYIITKYALQNPLFREISTTTKYEMAETNKHPQKRFVYHTNLMLDQNRGGAYYYPNMKGVKTGTSDESGRNLISMASKDGYNYMLITMGAPIYDDTKKMLPKNLSYVDAENFYDWAFKNYKLKNIVSTNSSIAEVKVKLSSNVGHILLSPEKELSYLLPTGIDISNIQQKINVPEYVKAPISVGQVIGDVELRLRDETLGKVNLVSTQDVGGNFILVAFDKVSILVKSTGFKIFLVIAGILLLLYFISIIRYRNRKKLNIFKK